MGERIGRNGRWIKREELVRGADQGQREQRDEKELVQNQNGLIGMSTESTEEGCRDGRE